MRTLLLRVQKSRQKGQGTLEYLGIAVLIAVLIAGLVTVPVGDAIGKGLRGVICKINHSATAPAPYSGNDVQPVDHTPDLAATIAVPRSVQIVAGDCPYATGEKSPGKQSADNTNTSTQTNASGQNGATNSANNTKEASTSKKSDKKSDSKDSSTSKNKSDSGKKKGPVNGTPIDVSPQGFEGPFVKGDDGFVYDSNGDRVPHSNSRKRPAYGDGQVEAVWKASRDQQLKDIENGDLEVDENGFVPTKLKPNEMYVIDIDGNWRSVTWKPGQSRQGKWDMGHRAGHEYRKTYKDYMDGKISKDEFLKIYRDPDNYKVEDPKRNQSHVDEDKSDQE